MSYIVSVRDGVTVGDPLEDGDSVNVCVRVLELVAAACTGPTCTMTNRLHRILQHATTTAVLPSSRMDASYSADRMRRTLRMIIHLTLSRRVTVSSTYLTYATNYKMMATLLI